MCHLLPLVRVIPFPDSGYSELAVGSYVPVYLHIRPDHGHASAGYFADAGLQVDRAAAWRNDEQIFGHCLRLSSADAQRFGKILQDEDAHPSRHRALGVTMVQVEDEHRQTNGHRSQCHRARQVDH